jgi:hypothetical protein
VQTLTDIALIPSIYRLADTIQLAFVTHALYYYMVTNYDNPIALLYPNWYALDIDIIDKVLTTPIQEHSRKSRDR